MNKSRSQKPKSIHHIEDWLDDQSSSRKQGKSIRASARKSNKTATWTPAEETNGFVTEIFRKQCKAVLDGESTERLCNYRKSQIYFEKTEGHRERSPVVVGDRVKIEKVGSRDGIVVGVSRRRNTLVRPAPGRETEVHVLIANVDQLMIVASVSEPSFSSGLVDRFLISAQVGKVPAMLIINKIDLLPDSGRDSAKTPWALYRDLGMEIFEVSARTGEGLDKLLEKASSKVTVFCGHSGVGKTSVLNALAKKLESPFQGSVGAVNEFTGKGRHTTTGASLILCHQNTKFVDTPGLRSLGLHGVSASTLREYFQEFQSLPCTNRDCYHDAGLEDCDARELPRYESYLRIRQSLIEEASKE